MDRRVGLLLGGAIAAAAMYPLVSPLDTADPAKPQHYGLTVIVVVIVYLVLAALFLLENLSKRRQQR